MNLYAQSEVSKQAEGVASTVNSTYTLTDWVACITAIDYLHINLLYCQGLKSVSKGINMCTCGNVKPPRLILLTTLFYPHSI